MLRYVVPIGSCLLSRTHFPYLPHLAWLRALRSSHMGDSGVSGGLTKACFRDVLVRALIQH